MDDLRIEKYLSRRSSLLKASQVRELLKWIGRDVISLGGGVPDPASFPLDELKQILVQVIEEKGSSALQYAPTEGVEELRQALAKFMGEKGIKAEAENILVTSGSQEALELVARVLFDKDDTVISENPTYLGALQAFSLYEPRLEGVPMDDNGLIVEALEAKIKKVVASGRRVKLAYLIPTCQNPTGKTLDANRRKRVLELAEEYDFLLLEDDPYSYFYLDGVEPRSLKSMDASGRVIYVSTISKVLAPGLRMGWVVAERDLIEKLVLAKQGVTLQSTTLCMYVLLEALKRGLVAGQMPKLREIYRVRRDTMLEALDEYMPEGVTWTRPSGGMFVWIEAPSNIDMDALLPVALNKYKVAYVPGSSFHVDGSGRNTARLSFSYPPLNALREGVARLASLLVEHMSRVS
ncbi:MAG: PLP-dependent aminotransferase family protein [Thermofilaceae archaeon]|nr:PLP-dependent aminotransferase family protein [Thermofilaceae archaeon]MCX8180077.1 PLP-dependent aminotransferase family protein [Thermofilaceae archaeon]MDW8004268.1 PLP-dependent aminotransferase family protein [Thermofilaceae archaeon]